MTEKKAKLSRRNFLLTASVGAAAAAIVVKSSSPVKPAAGTDKHATRGYQVSEHINNYYRTTKV